VNLYGKLCSDRPKSAVPTRTRTSTSIRRTQQNMSRRRSISKFVLESRDQYNDSTIRVYTEKPSTTPAEKLESEKEKEVLSEPRVYDAEPSYRVRAEPPSFRVFDSEPSYRVRADPPSFRVYDSEPSFRVRSEAPSFRVRDSEPSFRVRNDMPGFRVMSELPGHRVRPGGMPSSIVHGQHQETPSRKVLNSRSHRRTASTNMATTVDARVALFKQRKAKQDINRSASYQNFAKRRRYFEKEQVLRLVPNRQPPRRPDGSGM